jgi:hypothetical protein
MISYQEVLRLTHECTSLNELREKLKDKQPSKSLGQLKEECFVKMNYTDHLAFSYGRHEYQGLLEGFNISVKRANTLDELKYDLIRFSKEWEFSNWLKVVKGIDLKEKADNI